MSFVAVHLGVGERPHRIASLKAIIERACLAALDALERDETANSAVLEALLVLEHGHVNAGFGSVLARNGKIYNEAVMMNSVSLKSVAITHAQGLLHPSWIVHSLMQCHEQATDGCDAQGRVLPLILAGSEIKSWMEEYSLPMLPSCCETLYSNEISITAESTFTRHLEMIQSNKGGDTIGVIVYDDRNKVIVAGSSSGGLSHKHAARVGPAGTLGAAVYAVSLDDVHVACCTTGTGEQIMANFLALRLCESMQKAITEKNDIYQSMTRSYRTFAVDQVYRQWPQAQIYSGALMCSVSPEMGSECWLLQTAPFLLAGSATSAQRKVTVHQSELQGTLQIYSTKP